MAKKEVDTEAAGGESDGEQREEIPSEEPTKADAGDGDQSWRRRWRTR